MLSLTFSFLSLGNLPLLTRTSKGSGFAESRSASSSHDDEAEVDPEPWEYRFWVRKIDVCALAERAASKSKVSFSKNFAVHQLSVS